MANYRSSALGEKALIAGQSRYFFGDSMWNGQASISIASPSHWTARVFVDNITDENGAPARFSLGPTFDVRVQPRTIGAQVEFSFK